MICPYCGKKSNFKNTNLTHKYLHDDCNNYMKRCSICDTLYAEENNYDLDNCIEVENLFELDNCSVCGKRWLPDFPTSWTRSFTNLNKIYEFIKDINSNHQKRINADNLYEIQRSHYGVIFNKKRAEVRGIDKYISGSGRRRMLEYFNVLKNMGLLKIESYQKYGRLNHEFTKLGDEFVNSSEPEDIIAFFIIGFLNIKLNNGYQRNQSTSNYQYFKIRFAHNLFKVINYIENNYNTGASKYQIGLSFLARNKEQFTKQTIKELNRFSSEQIKKRYFVQEDELNRAVVCTFINPFKTLNILKEKNGLYFLTDLGKNLLEILNNRPAIWYEDIMEYSANNDIEINTLFAKLILWRLIKNDFLKKDETSIDLNNLDKIIEEITSKNIEVIEDIHLNLYYDEPLYKKSHNNTEEILGSLFKLIETDSQIEKLDLIELVQALQYSCFDKIREALDEETIEKLTNLDDDGDMIFSRNLQSGQEWHNKSKELFEAIGFDTEHYKNNKLFEQIYIKGLDLKLPGGTIYNPDLIIFEDGFGPENCILVDPKDQNSIDAEIPKLMGYNEYSNDPRVQSYTLIPLRGKLSSAAKTRIESNIEEFEKITIVEENALNKIKKEKLEKEEVLDLLIPYSGFRHITENDI